MRYLASPSIRGTYGSSALRWSARQDLNLQPPAPKAGALPFCYWLIEVVGGGVEPTSLGSYPSALSIELSDVDYLLSLCSHAST